MRLKSKSIKLSSYNLVIIIFILIIIVLTYEVYKKYSSPQYPNRGKFKPLWEMAMQKMKEGKMDEAQKYINMSDEVRLTDPEFWTYSAWENLKMKRYDEAIRRFDRAASFDPKDYEPFYGMGKAMLLKTLDELALDPAQLDKIEDIIKTSMSLNNHPKNNKAYFFYELVYRLKSVSKEIHPNQAVQYFLKGERLMVDEKSDLYELAREEYKKALQIDPQFSQAYQMLGIIYYVKKDFIHALSSYEKALEINPKNAQIYRVMADLYAIQNDFNTAYEYCQKTIETDPVYGNNVINMKQAKELRERVRLPAVPL